MALKSFPTTKMAATLYSLLVITSSAVAHTGESDIRTSLKSIESQLAALAKNTPKPAKNPAEIDSGERKIEYRVKSLETRIEGLEQETRRLTSLIEKLEHRTYLQEKERDSLHQNGSQKDELTEKNTYQKQTSETEFAHGVLKATRSAPSAEASTKTTDKIGDAVTSLPQENLPTNNDVTDYNKLQKLIHTHKVDEALEQASYFLKEHPNSSLRPNVLYWQGELYRLKSNYESAAANFLTLYKDHPRHHKAPEALLKLAQSLKDLEKDNEAVVTLDKLIKEYPDSSENIKAIASALKTSIASKDTS